MNETETRAEHLHPLRSFDSYVFPWDHSKRTLYVEFAAIPENAKLADDTPMPKLGKNGGWYGFHDLRRGFATENAASMDLFELQKLMQLKSLETTRGYVNIANRLERAVSEIKVPTLRRAGTA